MGKNLSTPTAESVYFQVFDGQYVSDLFETLEEGIADAETCAADENFSGTVAVIKYELCNAGVAGVIVHQIVDILATGDLTLPTLLYSHAVKALYEEHGDRLNAIA